MRISPRALCLLAGVAAVLGARVLPAADYEVSFKAPRAFAVGSDPYFVAVGDFDGDGRKDLATANVISDDVSILLGNGDGTFQVAVNHTAGTDPRSLAVGDFDANGKPDLAVANNGSANVSILLGNGDGTFQAALNHSLVGTYPESVAVGDFNGDGKADLAVAHGSTGSLSILLGNGDGTFQPASADPTSGISSNAVAVADLNGDGKLDLALGTYTGSGSRASVLLGNGDGTFQAAAYYVTGIGPCSVAVGDVNGDGTPDLAVANKGSASVSILLGNGDGTFPAAVNYASGTSPSSVAVGDFNGDGKLDLATANDGVGGSDNVSILLGNGDGTFPAAVNYKAGEIPRAIAAADFDGDGSADLAVANYNASNVAILLSNGDGTFQAATGYGTGSSPWSAAVGDFDGNGTGDLVVTNSGSANVSVLLGAGDGTFGAAANYGAGTNPRSVAVGDLDADGDLDLAVANYGSASVSILLGAGDGTFAAAANYGVGTTPQSVAVGDLDGDGDLDLAVANYGSKSVSILLGTGNGTFAAAVNYSLGFNGYANAVAMGDLDGDGDLDLAVARFSYVAVLLGAGDGTFAGPVNYDVAASPVSIQVADLNGDGRLDLTVAPATFSSGANAGVLLGDGDGTFQAIVRYATGTYSSAVAAADFNGGGVPDLAVISSPNYFSILSGNGDGTFPSPANYAVGRWVYGLATGDFNGDGKPDLAVPNGYTNEVMIALNTTLRAPAVTNPTTTSLGPTTATLGGTVTSDGWAAITGRGVVYAVTSLNPEPEIGGPGVTQVAASGTMGVFTVDVTGLLPGTAYSFRAYATNSEGAGYTSPVSAFTTLDAPTLASPTSTAITDTTATLGGDVTSDGGAAITERGVVYSVTATNPDPAIGGAGVTQASTTGTTGAFTVDVAGLLPATAYSFKAYAINSVGTSYTAPASAFTTDDVPTLASPTSASITDTSATLGGDVVSDGGAAITERGVVYSVTATNPDPAIGGAGVTRASTSGTTGAFTVAVTGLVPGTGYSFKAYAVNSVGTSYTAPASTFTTRGTDLSITVTDGRTAVRLQEEVTYTIVVSNAGPDPVTAATVTDRVPGNLALTGWTCTATGGSTCRALAPRSAGGLKVAPGTASLPAGTSVTYLLRGRVMPSTVTSLLRNSAAVAAPGGVTDRDLGNNTASDTDTITLRDRGTGAF